MTNSQSASLIALLLAASKASATILYAASYSGLVTTLNLTVSDDGASLESISSSDGCAGSPSWLTLDYENAVLYCTDEGFSTFPNGSFVSFQTDEEGTLTVLDKEVTIDGPVSAVLYGNGGLALAHYAGSGLTAWDVSDPGDISHVQTEVYQLAEPGADPGRQDAPHPHQAITDPTGKFILVPDLGADLVRIFAVGETLGVTAIEPLAVAPGSGPRHAAFAVHCKATFFYLVNELTNTINGYKVTYGEGSISFEQVWESGTHGEDSEVPEGAAAAEILVSADQKFLIVSSRNENAFEIPDFNTSNSNTIPSDVLINFSIDATSGALKTLQEVPSGGRFPRQFSLNKEGTLVAVGLQRDERVVLIERDAVSGLLGDFVASVSVEGDVTAVIFDE